MCEYYATLTARGMKRIMVLVAIARKLLRIIYAVVRDDSEYKADYGLLKRKVIKKGCVRYNYVGGEIIVFFH
jgi:hypothetical protein